MDEQQRWTPADDEVVRGALDDLRRDVGALPLADVRFVRARGVTRRRRAVVAGVASVAAAVAAIGLAGFHALGSNQAFDPRPATGTTPTLPSTRSPNPPVFLPVPGPLPVSAEWAAALGITETVQITDLRPGEGVFADCPVRAPGAQFATGSVHAESSGLDAAQAAYRAPSPEAGDAAAAAVVSQLRGCRQMTVRTELDVAWPKVFSSVTANSHNWYVVSHRGALTSLITLTEPGTANPRHTPAQIHTLARIAQERLLREADAASLPSPSTPASTQSTPVNEVMPVAGTRPLLSSNLFVAASLWSSPGLSAGRATQAVTTDFEGSAQLFVCDADQAQDGTAGAGRFGIVNVADQVTGTFLGKQRVRLTGSPVEAAAERQRLIAGIKACPTTNSGVSVTSSAKDPSHFKILSRLGSDQQQVSWVAVTVNERTPGAVSTIYLRGTPALVDGFGELDRLVALAVQK